MGFAKDFPPKRCTLSNPLSCVISFKSNIYSGILKLNEIDLRKGEFWAVKGSSISYSEKELLFFLRNSIKNYYKNNYIEYYDYLILQINSRKMKKDYYSVLLKVSFGGIECSRRVLNSLLNELCLYIKKPIIFDLYHEWEKNFFNLKLELIKICYSKGNINNKRCIEYIKKCKSNEISWILEINNFILS